MLSTVERLSQQRPARLGETVFQKIIFWSQMRLHELSLDGPRASFYRYTHGPFSRDVERDVRKLRELKHLEGSTFRLSPRGREIAVRWREALEPLNREVFSVVSAMAEDLGPLSAEAVKRKTYALPAERVGAPAKYRTLKDVPTGVALLLARARQLKPFVISDDDVADLVLDLSITGSRAAAVRAPQFVRTTASEIEATLDEQ